MSPGFNAYYLWLGIPPEEQPPTHYRLLGLREFEDNPSVISHAADQRMAHVRTFQSGEHARESQLLLNEISAATGCLLDAARKAAYDASLHRAHEARFLPNSPMEARPNAGGIGHSLLAGAGLLAAVVVCGLLLIWFGLGPGKPKVADKISPAKVADSQRDSQPSQEQATAQETPDAPLTSQPTDIADPFRRPQQTIPLESAKEPLTPNDETSDPPGPKAPPHPPTQLPAAAPDANGRADARAPIPPPADIAKSQGLLNEVYGTEIASAKTPDSKQALAERFLKDAVQAKKDLDAWVLLQTAKELAVGAAHGPLVRSVCEALGKRFVLDGAAAEVEALLRIPADSLTGPAATAFAERLLALLPAALERDDFDQIRRLAESAKALATSAKDNGAVRRATQVLEDAKATEPQFHEARAARAKLAANPLDEEANLHLGRYLCFVHSDWKAGLPLLALGGDARLRALAAREVQGVAGEGAVVGLADDWWDYAARSDQFAGVAKRHATDWYRTALPKLEGLERAKVEKRIAEGDAQAFSLFNLASRTEPSSEPPSADPDRPAPLTAPFSSADARESQNQWARYLKLKAHVVKIPSGLSLAVVPPGEFLMGTPEGEAGRMPAEGPQHKVRLTKAILVGVHEVTQGEYAKLMGNNPSYYAPTGGGRNVCQGQNTSRFPVESVTWFDACKFCNRLSQAEKLGEFYTIENAETKAKSITRATVSIQGGKGYRLPTEAEFEYFTRSGTLTPYPFGSVHDGTQGNVMGTKPYGVSRPGPFLNRTTTVGSYPGNAFGIHDTDGNVGEFCWDYFDPGYYARFRSTTAIDPTGPETGSKRVSRSNSSQYEPVYSRSGRRHAEELTTATGWTGFRVVRNAE